MHPEDFLLRAATAADLDALERMARASAVGITTLPPDRDALALRLERSDQAFATADDASGEEIYLFVLEDLAQGRIVGTSGIAASAGFADRFYSYRNEMVVAASAALAARNRIHTLHLCHDLTGHTLLTSFYIEPDYEHSAGAQLLSRARLLFIAQHGERFSDRIAAESPGLSDEQGRCPFWDAVGRRFFGMDYPAAEKLTGARNKAFIAELLPQSPIYVPLLPEEAQFAIGQMHPVAELPFSILQDEGFDSETYVDIFDGGPIVDARVAVLKSVAASQERVLAGTLANTLSGTLADAPTEAPTKAPTKAQSGSRRVEGLHLLATTERARFRAVVARAQLDDGGLRLAEAAAARLAAATGDTLRVAPFIAGGAA